MNLNDVLVTLKNARVFISSREIMHPDGIALYDELIASLESVAEPVNIDLFNWFAGMALQGLLSQPESYELEPKEVANIAYDYAHAMASLQSKER